jgi:hypothetical protein
VDELKTLAGAAGIRDLNIVFDSPWRNDDRTRGTCRTLRRDMERTEPIRRHQRVADLWNETAVRYNHAGEQIGREAIARAVISTYERFGANGYRFRALDNTVGHHNPVKFSWENEHTTRQDGLDRHDISAPRR